MRGVWNVEGVEGMETETGNWRQLPADRDDVLILTRYVLWTAY